jgi:hypothetical protein
MVYCFPLWSNPLLRASNIYSGGMCCIYICMIMYHASGYQSLATLWPLITGIPFLFLPFWEQKIVKDGNKLIFSHTLFSFGSKQIVESVSVKREKKNEHIVVTIQGKLIDTQFYGLLDDRSSIVNKVLDLKSNTQDK